MDRDTIVAYIKIVLLWLVAGVEWLTTALPKIALIMTIIYTGAQLYVLWRDKLRTRPKQE